MSISDRLGIDVNKYTQKNPASAEMDEQSKKLESLTTDNISKIRSPRNQARQIDRTVERASDNICDTVSKKIQALLSGEITPKEFAKALGDLGENSLDSLLKDGLGVKDIKDLGKKAALAGAMILADRAGVDDQLQALLGKLKSNKRKMRDISDAKKQEDQATKEIFKKLPPVVRQILKGDKNALQRFIDQHCTEAQRNVRNNAYGRAGLSGKLRNFVDDR
jgi:hypothetical protein